MGTIHSQPPGKTKAALAGGGTEPVKRLRKIWSGGPRPRRGAPVLRKERGRIQRFVWLLLPDEVILPERNGEMLDNLRTFYEVFVNGEDFPGHRMGGRESQREKPLIFCAVPGRWPLCAGRRRSSCTGARPCGGGGG